MTGPSGSGKTRAMSYTKEKQDDVCGLVMEDHKPLTSFYPAHNEEPVSPNDKKTNTSKKKRVTRQTKRINSNGKEQTPHFIPGCDDISLKQQIDLAWNNRTTTEVCVYVTDKNFKYNYP